MLRRAVGSAEYGQRCLPLANQLLGAARTKRASATQQKYRFKDRCLSRAVRPGDQVEIRRKLELGDLNAAEILDPQLGERHPRTERVKLQTHRHDDVLRIRGSDCADEATAIAISQTEHDLV